MVSIIIPVWNNWWLTNQILTALWQEVGSKDQIIVVDNASTDRTPEIITRWQGYFRGRLVSLRNSVNKGFGPANNQGAELALRDTLIFMSNDVSIMGPFVRSVSDALEEDPKRLVCHRVVDWPAGWNQFGPLTIPYAEGYFLAMHKTFTVDVGLFDERFVPCDYEDVDLSYRAARASYQLYPMPLPLKHAQGSSGANLGNRLEITEIGRAHV